jgi:hypothetical protein
MKESDRANRKRSGQIGSGFSASEQRKLIHSATGKTGPERDKGVRTCRRLECSLLLGASAANLFRQSLPSQSHHEHPE